MSEINLAHVWKLTENGSWNESHEGFSDLICSGLYYCIVLKIFVVIKGMKMKSE